MQALFQKREDPDPDPYPYLRLMDPDPDPYLRLMDPDPGGPKICGSGGSGSPTLVAGNIFV
jgi:hypothetical protein